MQAALVSEDTTLAIVVPDDAMQAASLSQATTEAVPVLQATS